VTLGRIALAVVAASLALGCQTTRSFSQGCGGTYSGVRYYQDQSTFIPLDGKIFFTFDLPLTVIADTLLLPVSWLADPQTPTGGFPPGCRWAGKSR